MNGIERLPRHQWLDELLADPQLAVADLLSGRADKYPYARLRDAEFLHQVLPHRQEHEREYEALETALVDWLEARRRENWADRGKRGLPAYVAALVEALSAIQMLGLNQAAYKLSERHKTYQCWLEPLRMGTATDPALELWRCHALLPQDHRYLPHWMRFCVEAGTAQPPTYLTVALQGLRELPTDNAGINLRYALHALAERYLARKALSEAQQELRQYCATLRFTYLRNPNDWRRVWDEALENMPGDRADAVRAALDGKTENKSGKPEPKKTRKQIDPSRFPTEANTLASSLKSGKPVADLWPRIEKLFNETLAFCHQTGNSFFFVSSFGWLGDLTLKSGRAKPDIARTLLAWMPEALEWKRDIPQTWMLWAHCLDRLGQWDYAEWVYWEMRRYFPNHEHSRVELARLLMRQERNVEAEALLREAAERNPNREPSRVELARLLMRQERNVEAEALLREAANRNPNHEHSRVELARLLMAKGKNHFLEAEALLREAAERNPNREPSRVELARLLMRQERNVEAEELLRQAAKRNPDHVPSRVVLAHLLIAKGRNHFPEAEALLRKVIQLNPDKASNYIVLVRLLIEKGKEHFPEAEALLRKVIKRHPDSEPSRVELAHLLDLRGDKPVAIALPLDTSTQRSEHPAVEFTETILPSLRGDNEMAMLQLEWEKEEADSTAPLPIRAEPAETIPAKPDALTQAAALAARDAFLMALADPQAAASGRDELLRALDANPDNWLAAFYLDWAQALPAGYKAPRDAYPLAASHAYHYADDDEWKEMIKHFPEQRHIIWSLHWLASLHGGEFSEKDWRHLENFAKQAEQANGSAVGVPGSDVVVQLVKNWGRTGAGRPATAAIDTRAQELIALTINSNLDPVAAAHKTNRGIHALTQ